MKWKVKKHPLTEPNPNPNLQYTDQALIFNNHPPKENKKKNFKQKYI